MPRGGVLIQLPAAFLCGSGAPILGSVFCDLRRGIPFGVVFAGLVSMSRAMSVLQGAMSGPGPTSKVTHGLPTWTPIDRTGDNERHQLRVMPTAATPRRVETVNLVLERKYLFRGTSPDRTTRATCRAGTEPNGRVPRKSGKDVNAIFRKFKEIGREVLPTDFNQNFLFFGTILRKD